MKSAAFMTHTLEYFYGHLLYIKELEKKSAYLWKSKPKDSKISKISFQILIDNWHFSFRFTFHTLTDNLLTNISIAYFIGGDAASKAQHTSAHVRDHCRPPAHLLYWLLPARRPARPKSLLVAFYGCINKSDKSLMLGPFMAFQPDCLIT